MDKKTVLKGLHFCMRTTSVGDCSGCPYRNDYSGFPRHDYGKLSCSSNLMEDAAALIKELDALNVSATGNATAIGVVQGGLVINKKV